MWRLVKQYVDLACRAPTWFLAHPLIWLSYQFNAFILIWGLELLRYVYITLFPIPQPKVMLMKMEYEEPIVKDIVLIGAGHAHVHVLKMFGMQPEPNVRITLVTEWIDTPYSGMLPGYVSGTYTRDECHIDVLRLAEFAKARVVIGRAQQVWMDSKTVVFEEGHAPIHFDLLSINIGSAPTLPRENSHLVIPVKPISHMMQQVERILARESDTRLRIAVVGGGAGGVEVALAMYHRLRNANLLSELVLISKSRTLCPSHSMQFQRLVEENVRRGTEIKLMLGCEVVAVNDSGKRVLRFANEAEEQEFDEVIWCTHARGADWLSAAFPVDDMGFVKVNTKLQVNPHVFAAGDCACFESSPLPKSGVFAVRQGPILATNLRLTAQGCSSSKLVDYVPQRTFLNILGMENGKLAMASRGEMGVAPCGWMWDLKEWIDRKWLSGYNELLPIRRFPTQLEHASKVALALSEDEQDELCRIGMKCGGCGSKVSSSLLAKSLAQLQVVKRKEVVCGLEAPDDCSLIQLGGDNNKLVVAATSVDFFRSIWRDEYVFGRIAVNHALSDVWAMGFEPVSALCIAQLPVSPNEKLQQRLQILMQGAVHQLNQANCALTGGHTTEGAELMMGFSVLGESTNDDDAVRKANVNAVQPGDVIILTKPIGTGTIMEAHMRLEANGLWVKAALDSMLLPNRMAAQVFSKFNATAMTDVTGFGLGGHLLEMMKPLVVANAEMVAQIELDSVPLLPGAVDCLEMQEYTSSLALRNERSGLKRMRHGFSNEEDLLVVSLLFDPQTSGGLLAFVPRDKSMECLHELKANGYLDAMRIGQVVSKQAGDKPALLVELI